MFLLSFCPVLFLLTRLSQLITIFFKVNEVIPIENDKCNYCLVINNFSPDVDCISIGYVKRIIIAAQLHFLTYDTSPSYAFLRLLVEGTAKMCKHKKKTWKEVKMEIKSKQKVKSWLVRLSLPQKYCKEENAIIMSGFRWAFRRLHVFQVEWDKIQSSQSYRV